MQKFGNVINFNKLKTKLINKVINLINKNVGL